MTKTKLLHSNSDFIFVILNIIVYIISIFYNIHILQIIFAPFIIWGLGYIFTIVLFPRNIDLSGIHRSILSFFVGISLLPLSSLLASLIFSRINIYSLLISITILILLGAILGLYRRSKLKDEERYILKIQSIYKYLNLNAINILMLFILISFIGLIIRVLPFINYSLFLGSWFPGNSFYHTLYTVQTGKLFDIGAVQTPTNFAGTIYNYRGLKGFILFQSSFFLLFGLTDLYQMLLVNKYVPIVGSLFIPLAAILVAIKIEEETNCRLSIYNYIMIYLLGCFVSFYTTFLTKYLCEASPYGWLFMLLSIYALLSKRIEYKVLSILFSFSLVWFYYTAASVYFIALLTILAIQTIFKKEVISRNYIIAYAICYISYLIYLAETVFHSYIRVIETTFSFQEHMKVITAIGEYTSPIEPVSLWYILLYINGILIGILCLLFIYYKFRKYIKYSISDIPYYLFMGLVVVSIIFLSWRGLKGFMGRMEQYVSTLLLVIFPLLLVYAKNKHRLKKLIYIITILIIVTSILSHLLNNVMQVCYITHGEKSAIEWYVKYGSNKRVFTDFRIGTAPVLLGCWVFTGIMTVPQKLGMEELQKLINIYYTDNATMAYKTISKYYRASFILLSKEMCARGVVTSSENFKPISPNLFSIYDRSKLFDKIYDNGNAYYYMLK